jgi:hypothetical protein
MYFSITVTILSNVASILVLPFVLFVFYVSGCWHVEQRARSMRDILMASGEVEERLQVRSS